MTKKVKLTKEQKLAIAEVVKKKIHLIYQLAEVINEVSNEIEVHLGMQNKYNFADKFHIERIKRHSDQMSMYAGNNLSEEAITEFGLTLDNIKRMIYEELELPESVSHIIESEEVLPVVASV